MTHTSLFLVVMSGTAHRRVAPWVWTAGLILGACTETALTERTPDGLDLTEGYTDTVTATSYADSDAQTDSDTGNGDTFRSTAIGITDGRAE